MNDNEQDRKDKNVKYEGDAILLEGRIENVEREQKDRKARDEKYKDDQLWTNRLLAGFTLGLLITSVISVLVYFDLSVTSKRTADAAQESAAAANNAALIAGKTLLEQKNSSADTLAAMTNQVNKLQAGVDQTSRLAKAAESTNTISQGLMEVQTRPWIGVEEITPGKMVLKNYGQTPAIVGRRRNFFVTDQYPGNTADYDYYRVCESTDENFRFDLWRGFYIAIFPGRTQEVIFSSVPKGPQSNLHVLMGCIPYQGRGGIYHTRLMYLIQHNEGKPDTFVYLNVDPMPNEGPKKYVPMK